MGLLDEVRALGEVNDAKLFNAKPAKRSGSNQRKQRVEASAEAPVEIKAAKAKPERKPIGDRQRFRVLHKFHFTCVYCGAKAGDTKKDGTIVKVHADHKISVADGGTNADENLVCACEDCNLGKGRKSVRQAVGGDSRKDGE